jgi:rhodanese-related sulfurtransferase
MRCNPGVLAAIALLLVACDAGWLGERGLRVIREVSPREAARLLEAPGAVLLQVRGPGATGVRVEGTAVIGASDPLPEGLAEPDPTVVILAEDREQGMALAARLARAGIQRVAVVNGGVEAWLAAQGDGPHQARPAAAGTGVGEAARKRETGMRTLRRGERHGWLT